MRASDSEAVPAGGGACGRWLIGCVRWSPWSGGRRGRFSWVSRGGRWPHWIPILAPWEDRSAPHSAALATQPRNHAGTAECIRGADPNDPPRAPFPASSGLRESLLRVIGSHGAPLASNRGSAGLLRVIGSRDTFESPSGAAPARPGAARTGPGAGVLVVAAVRAGPAAAQVVLICHKGLDLAGAPKEKRLIFRASSRRRSRRGAPLWQIWTRPRPGLSQESHPHHPAPTHSRHYDGPDLRSRRFR